MKLTVNGEEYRHAGDDRLQSLLQALNPDDRKIAVVLNENVVPMEDATTRRLREGDSIEILTLAGGG